MLRRMEQLKSLIESFKLGVYDLLAVLLPGAAVVEGVAIALDLGDALAKQSGFLVAGAIFVVGLFLQAIAASYRPLVAHPSVEEMRDRVKKVIDGKLRGLDLPRSELLNYCLSTIESRRAVHDKFVALRDMTRGLAVAAAVVCVALLFGRPLPLAGRAYAVVVSAAVVWLLWTRYRTFAPLAELAVYSQFLAAEPVSVVPDPPAGLAATASDGEVRLTWRPAGGVSYNLYWSSHTGVTRAAAKIAGVSSPYLHSGVENGKPCHYVLTAETPAGESAPSVEVAATPAAAAEPAALLSVVGARE